MMNYANESAHAHAHLMQYSVFGSILTIGAMLGAIVSGSIADRAGRRGVSVNPIPTLPNPATTELGAPSNFTLKCRSQTASQRDCFHLYVYKCSPSVDFFHITLQHHGTQAMAISDILCALGYLLIGFSQVQLNPQFFLDVFLVLLSSSHIFFFFPGRIIGGLTLEGCLLDVESGFCHMW
jgi:MFS family permease